VLNRPENIPNTQRDTACQILQDISGVLIPTTYRTTREQLASITETASALSLIAHDLDFPLIVRPLDSHAGRDLERVGDCAALQRYLDQVTSTEFFIAPFIDYSGADGLFRKFRIALVGGKPFAVHMAVSAHWMIHYVNAGMYEDAEKRQEEAQFMTNFDAFITRHEQALSMIAERMGLDYVCFDGAETQAGELLIFEIDHVMVVHAMDPVELFPYKQEPIRQIQTAFRQLLATSTAETG
jgi:glutathione synthase/RimK-type ligase-like ATP-grasp enzyme